MAETKDQNFPPEAQKLPTEFSFSELSNLQVITSEKQPQYGVIRSNLLTVANKYGYIFIGTPEGLKVFLCSDVLESGKKEQKEVTSPIANIVLRNPPNWIAINSDNLTLSVCCRTNKGPQILFFDVRNITNKSKQIKTPFHNLFLNKDPSAYVTSMEWNPSQEWPNLLALCLSTGSFHLLSVQDSATEKAIRPDDFGASTVCWSPKGKQMIIGKKDGTLHQLTQQLEVRRTVSVTNVIDKSVCTTDMLWLSTFHVAAAYVASEDDSFTQPNLFLADMPSKNEERDVVWTGYNDPCFGMNESCESRYFFAFLEQWQLFVTLSSNSTDTAVIAQNKESQIWEIWSLDDAARATLPFSEFTEDDSSPIGVDVIMTANERINLSEAKDCRPMPVMAILTNDGVLCLYHIINLMANYPNLTRPVEALDPTGERTAVGGMIPRIGEGDTSKLPAFPMKQRLTLKPSIPPTMSTPKANLQPPSSKLDTSHLSKPSFSASTPLVAKLPPFSEGPSMIQQPSLSKPPLTRETLMKPSVFIPKKHPAHDETADSVFGSNKTGSSESVFTIKESERKQLEPDPTGHFKAQISQPTVSQLPFKTTPISTSSERLATEGTTSGSSRTITPVFSRDSKTSTVKTSDRLNGATSSNRTPTVKSLPTEIPPKTMMKTPLALHPSIGAFSQVKKFSPSIKSSNVDLMTTLDDITNFEKELEQFQASILGVDVIEESIGGNSEKTKMQKKVKLLDTFSKEICGTVQELSNEIQDSSTSLLALISDAEDVIRKRNHTSLGAYKALLYSRPLERSKRQKLEVLRGLYQYVVSSVREANSALDAQWEETNNQKRALMGLRTNKRGRVQMGNWEAAYHGLVNNMKILNNQEAKIMLMSQELNRIRLEIASSQVPFGTRTSMPSTVAGKASTDLQRLADVMLLPKGKTPSPESTQSPRSKQSSRHKMSPKKQAQLGQMLANRWVSPVRASAKISSSIARPTVRSVRRKGPSPVRSDLSESVTPHEEPSPPVLDDMTSESPRSESPPVPSDKTLTPVMPRKRQVFLNDSAMGDYQFPSDSFIPKTSEPVVPTTSISSMIPRGAATLAYGAPISLPANTRRRDLPALSAAGNAEAASNLNNPPQVVNIQKFHDPIPVPELPDKFDPKPEVPAGAVEVVQTVLNIVKAEKQQQKPKEWSSNQGETIPNMTPFSSVMVGNMTHSTGGFVASTSNLSPLTTQYKFTSTPALPPSNRTNSSGLLAFSSTSGPLVQNLFSPSNSIGIGQSEKTFSGPKKEVFKSASMPLVTAPFLTRTSSPVTFTMAKTNTAPPSSVFGSASTSLPQVMVNLPVTSAAPNFSAPITPPSTESTIESPATTLFPTSKSQDTTAATATLSMPNLHTIPSSTTTRITSSITTETPLIPPQTMQSSPSASLLVSVTSSHTYSSSADATNVTVGSTTPSGLSFASVLSTTASGGMSLVTVSPSGLSSASVQSTRTRTSSGLPSQSTPSTTPSNESPFGDVTLKSGDATSSGGSLFQTESRGLFGNPSAFEAKEGLFSATEVTSSSSVFGAITAGTTSNVFGSISSTSATSNLFGSMPASSAPSGVFSAASSTSSAPGSFKSVGSKPNSTEIFGSGSGVVRNPPSSVPTPQSTIITGSNVFGSMQPAVSSGAPQSIFGGGGFGSAGVSSAPSIFGSPASNSGPFGSASVFGQPQENKPAFGGGFGAIPAFAQSSFGGGFENSLTTSASQPSGFSGGFGSSFAAQPSSFDGGFGFSGLGGKPSSEATNKNPFQVARQQDQEDSKNGSSLFGNSGAKSFGQIQMSVFDQVQAQTGASVFNSPSGGVGSQGFGGFNKRQPSGFGSTVAFGSGAAFTSPTSFGSMSNRTFGAGFGANAPSGGSVFGQQPTNVESSGFASFARNDSPGFGNLAGQTVFGSPPQTQNTFGGSAFVTNTQKNSSFSGWR